MFFCFCFFEHVHMQLYIKRTQRRHCVLAGPGDELDSIALATGEKAFFKSMTALPALMSPKWMNFQRGECKSLPANKQLLTQPLITLNRYPSSNKCGAPASSWLLLLLPDKHVIQALCEKLRSTLFVFQLGWCVVLLFPCLAVASLWLRPD